MPLEADPQQRQCESSPESSTEPRGTVLVVVPDCGRDDNPFLDVPCQHHFGSRASHEIFALVVGPGIPAGKVVDRRVSQVDIAPTIGRLMGFATPHAEGSVLTEVFG